MKDSKLLFNKWAIKKVILVLVVIILILSGWAWGYFVHDRSSKTILDLRNGIVDLNYNNSKLNEELVNTEKKYEEAKQTNDELQSSKDELQSSKDEIEKELEAKKSDYYAVLNELSTYKSYLYCLKYENFDTNYINTTSVSTNLENYVKSISDGQVFRNYNHTLWNDSRTTHHDILMANDRGEIYGYKFIVYYDEEGFTEKAVYYINGQCWLYNKAFEE